MNKRGMRKRIRNMGKKGQIFLLAAIIIIFMIFMVTYPYNTINVHAGLEDFDQNVKHYQKESSMVINEAIYLSKNGTEQAAALKEWAGIYKESIKNSDPNFGTISIYKDTDGNVHIINTLTNKSITIEYLAEGANAEGTNISFFSKDTILPKDTTTKGKICSTDAIFGKVCTEVSTDVSNFGKSFDYSKTIAGADLDYLCIKIQGMDLGKTGICPDGYYRLDLKGGTDFGSISISEKVVEENITEKGKSAKIIKIKYTI